MPACWGLLPLLLLGCASAAQNDDVPPAVSDRGVPKSSLDLIVLQALCIQHNISVDVGDDAKVPSLSTKRDSTKDALVVRLLNAGVSRAEIGLPLEPGSIEAQVAAIRKGMSAEANKLLTGLEKKLAPEDFLRAALTMAGNPNFAKGNKHFWKLKELADKLGTKSVHDDDL